MNTLRTIAVAILVAAGAIALGSAEIANAIGRTGASPQSSSAGQGAYAVGYGLLVVGGLLFLVDVLAWLMPSRDKPG